MILSEQFMETVEILEMARRVREAIGPEMPLLINTRDFSQKTELEGVGRSVAHIARIYEETGWELRKGYSTGWNIKKN